jgi:hypothetical protein
MSGRPIRRELQPWEAAIAALAARSARPCARREPRRADGDADAVRDDRRLCGWRSSRRWRSGC